MKINNNYLNLESSYLFSTISKKVSAYKASNPDKSVISLGIGDVSRPIDSHIVEELLEASREMGNKETFKGYGPEQGYTFIKEEIKNYYEKNNILLDSDSIFISDGAKSDLGNILDIFSVDNTVLIPNPVYPVYVDTNVMAGRKILFMDANESNNFLPLPDDNVKADIIYLCSPNNPTGAVYSREALKSWVEYANKIDAVILFDAAYEAFIVDKDIPRSIYEIEGSKECAIEFCSLSKTAGFTGLRLGYTIVPNELERENTSLNKLWLRRQTTKFNGVSYVIQKAGAIVFSKPEIIKNNIKYYQENAKVMVETLKSLGIWFTGGTNSPYIWMKIPFKMTSWEFFDYLLENIAIVGTPGVGFGENGEGYFRLTAFNSHENTISAMERFKGLINKEVVACAE